MSLCSTSGRSLLLRLLGRDDGGVDLLAVLPADTGRRSTVTTTLTRPHTDDYRDA
jgi:hypothetical protein